MLIEVEVKTELPIILLFQRLLKWCKQVFGIIFGEQRTA